MTSQINFRLFSFARSIYRTNASIRIEPTTMRHNLNDGCHSNQVRYAGHAKWQNIASTKQKTDMAKGKLISRFVQQIRKAVVSNGFQADPKLNGKLAELLQEGAKMNIPKATTERAIARAINIKIYPVNLEITGPGGCAMIVRCETENASLLRREVKKVLKKFDSILMPEDSLINMFKSRGTIRATTKTTDGRSIDKDFAEEAAIVANAEDVTLETYEDTTDPELGNVWVFATDAVNLNPCKGELEKLHIKVLSHDLDLVPYRGIDFGPGVYEKALELGEALRELDQVIDVYHNIVTPQLEQEQQEKK